MIYKIEILHCFTSFLECSLPRELKHLILMTNHDFYLYTHTIMVYLFIIFQSLSMCTFTSWCKQKNESDKTIIDILKKHTIKDAIVLFKKAWDEISMSILKISWKKTLAYDDEDYDEEDLLPLSELQPYSTEVQWWENSNVMQILFKEMLLVLFFMIFFLYLINKRIILSLEH